MTDQTTENLKKLKQEGKAALARHMAQHLMVLSQTNNWPEPTPEYRFHPKRRWRFDFAYPELKIAVEVEGGTWTKGAHVRGKHFTSDCEKYNNAILLGWQVFRFTTDMIKGGHALAFLQSAFPPF